MIFNTRVALASAMLATEALAFNAHRAGHAQVHRQALQKKQDLVLHTEIVTETEVVYITVYDDEVTSTPVAFFKGAAPTPITSSSLSSSSSSSSTSSSTSTSTSSPAEVPAPPAPTPAPEPTPSPVAVPPAPVVVQPAPEPQPKAPAEEVKPPVVAQAPPPPVVEAPPPVVEAKVSIAIAAAPSPTPQVPAPVTPAPVAGGKRGVAFNDASFLNLFVGTKAASWCYSWAQTRDSRVPASFDFVPMMWCPNADHEPTWAKNAEKSIAEGAKEFLSFNEPDIPSQCNKSPGEIAGHHQRLMNPYAGRVRISSPSVSNSNIPGQGLDWLKSWIGACNGNCKFDFCAIHWYDRPNLDTFFKHMEAAHAICGDKPLWITEFAPVECTDDQAEDFIRKVSQEVDTNPKYSYIQRLTYFMAAVGAGPHSLLSSPTSLNRFGQAYASA